MRNINLISLSCLASRDPTLSYRMIGDQLKHKSPQDFKQPKQNTVQYYKYTVIIVHDHDF